MEKGNGKKRELPSPWPRKDEIKIDSINDAADYLPFLSVLAESENQLSKGTWQICFFISTSLFLLFQRIIYREN